MSVKKKIETIIQRSKKLTDLELGVLIGTIQLIIGYIALAIATKSLIPVYTNAEIPLIYKLLISLFGTIFASIITSAIIVLVLGMCIGTIYGTYKLIQTLKRIVKKLSNKDDV